MHIANETNNIKDDKANQSNEWVSREMRGRWDGIGRWNDDGKWRGHGTWCGGLLRGNWDGIGEWNSEDEQRGQWTGNGNLICNMSFYKYFSTPLLLLFLTITSFSIILSIYIHQFSKTVGIILVLFLMGMLIVLKKTNKGNWDAAGSWEDIEDSRILKFQGKWRLGYHEGLFNGEMKDSKP